MKGLVEKRVRSFDATELHAYSAGKGPSVILANGLGGPIGAYGPILKQLTPDYRILSWDYRGLYQSGRPEDPTAYSVHHHVGDMDFLAEREGFERSVVIGWSMGVQVALEYYRQHREKVSALVLLCGVPGSPFANLRGAPVLERALPALMDIGKKLATPISFFAHRLTQWKGLVPILQRAGVAADSLDMEVFREISQDFGNLDVEVYCEILKQLGRHDAHDVLPEIDVPTLIVCGTKDLMTPQSASEIMKRDIAGSRLVVVDGGTHYTPVEFPLLIESELDGFLRNVPGFEPPSSRQSFA